MANLDVARLSELPARLEESGFGPIHLQREGAEVAVVISPERYRELLMAGVPSGVRPLVVELLDESIKKHGALYRALARLD